MINLSELANLHVLEPMDLALHWASRGVPVLPCNPDTKGPWIGKQWEKKATTDPAQIREWKFRWDAGARVGIKTGLACGCGCEDGPDVLDFDVSDGKPGLEQLQTLVLADVLDGTQALRVKTPSGGEHWWFAGSTQHNKQNDDSVWGIDYRAHHGMVLAPGNPGYDVKGTPWDKLGSLDWSVVAACPGLKVKPPKPGRPGQPAPTFKPPPTTPRIKGKLVAPLGNFDNAPGEESPMDWYTRNHDLGQLLAADGWQFAYEQDGRAYYTRPGKRVVDGVSGNVMINADGRQTLINFSSTVDLPTDRGMSAAQWYAYRHHGGDFRAAAKEIRTTMMPRREPVPTMASVATPAAPAAGPLPSYPPGPAVVTTGTPGAELVPSATAGPPEPVREFWRRRPELREVFWKSQMGGVSPWAVLGNTLAQVAARIGPHVVLPAIGGVGKAASLNILVAVSGNSGTGKGLSGSVAREFMGKPYPPQRKPGTGQGIAAMFTEQTKEGPVQSNDTVVLNVSEITSLGAHMGQQGATITSTLLEVYMGEELGEHYANKELRRPVKDGHYRLAMVAGVQPGNSHIVFDHAESGLPQRFIWMPAYWEDAVLPEGELRPPAPGSEQARWQAWNAILPASLDDAVDETAADWRPGDAVDKKPGDKPKKEPEAVAVVIKDAIQVTYAPAVKREIERDRLRRLNAIRKRLAAGEDDPGDPDSHILLTRIKVATLLAVWLDNSLTVTDEMWELARWVIWVSNDTRLKAHARLTRKAAEKTAGRAAARVAENEVAGELAERKHNATYIKACDRLLHLLTVNGDWMVIGQLNRKMASKEKKAMRDADVDPADVLSDLELAGKIEMREPEGSEQGTRYRAKR